MEQTLFPFLHSLPLVAIRRISLQAKLELWPLLLLLQVIHGPHRYTRGYRR